MSIRDGYYQLGRLAGSFWSELWTPGRTVVDPQIPYLPLEPPSGGGTFDVDIAATAQAGVAAATLEQSADLAITATAQSGTAAATLEHVADLASTATAQAATAAATLEAIEDLAITAIAQPGVATLATEQTADLGVVGVAQSGVASAAAEQSADVALSATASPGTAAAAMEVPVQAPPILSGGGYSRSTRTRWPERRPARPRTEDPAPPPALPVAADPSVAIAAVARPGYAEARMESVNDAGVFAIASAGFGSADLFSTENEDDAMMALELMETA